MRERRMTTQASGRPAEALQSFKEAVAIKRKALGDAHPSVASSLNNIGAVLEVRRSTAVPRSDRT